MLYSVLMSVYIKENPAYFSMALDSMLHQSVCPDEIVLVCDGPLTKELDDVIARYEKEYDSVFKVVRLKENQGLGQALAYGLQHCRNELVARMDTDDVSVEHRLEIQLDYLQQHQEISVVGGQIVEFEQDMDHLTGKREVPCEATEVRKRTSFRNPMNHMSVLFRKSDVIAAGNYQSLIGYEDYELWARMQSKGYQLANVNEVLCYVRAGNSLQNRRGGWNYFMNAKKLMDRLKEYQLVNQFEYVRGLFVRFVGSVLLSNRVRGFLFQKLLRRSAHHEAA